MNNFEFIIDNLYTIIFKYLDLTDKLNVLSLNNKFTLLDYCFVIEEAYYVINSRPYKRRKIYPSTLDANMYNSYLDDTLECFSGDNLDYFSEIVTSQNLNILSKILINYEDFISWKNKPLLFSELHLFDYVSTNDEDEFIKYKIVTLCIHYKDIYSNPEQKNETIIVSNCKKLILAGLKKKLTINCKNLEYLKLAECEDSDIHFKNCELLETIIFNYDMESNNIIFYGLEKNNSITLYFESNCESFVCIPNITFKKIIYWDSHYHSNLKYITKRVPHMNIDDEKLILPNNNIFIDNLYIIEENQKDSTELCYYLFSKDRKHENIVYRGKYIFELDNISEVIKNKLEIYILEKLSPNKKLKLTDSIIKTFSIDGIYILKFEKYLPYIPLLEFINSSIDVLKTNNKLFSLYSKNSKIGILNLVSRQFKIIPTETTVTLENCTINKLKISNFIILNITNCIIHEIEYSLCETKKSRKNKINLELLDFCDKYSIFPLFCSANIINITCNTNHEVTVHPSKDGTDIPEIDIVGYPKTIFIHTSYQSKLFVNKTEISKIFQYKIRETRFSFTQYILINSNIN